MTFTIQPSVESQSLKSRTKDTEDAPVDHHIPAALLPQELNNHKQPLILCLWDQAFWKRSWNLLHCQDWQKKLRSCMHLCDQALNSSVLIHCLMSVKGACLLFDHRAGWYRSAPQLAVLTSCSSGANSKPAQPLLAVCMHALPESCMTSCDWALASLFPRLRSWSACRVIASRGAILVLLTVSKNHEIRNIRAQQSHGISSCS